MLGNYRASRNQPENDATVSIAVGMCAAMADAHVRDIHKSTSGQEALHCRSHTRHQNSFFQRQKATMLMKSKIANADDKVDTCTAQPSGCLLPER